MDSEKDWSVLVDEEIVDEISQLKGMAVGTEEYRTTVDGIVKLMKESNESVRLKAELKKSEEAQEFEKNQKLKQAKEELIDRWVKNGLTALSIIGGFALTIWGTNKTLRFEETGTITTTAGRKHTAKLFSWK